VFPCIHLTSKYFDILSILKLFCLVNPPPQKIHKPGRLAAARRLTHVPAAIKAPRRRFGTAGGGARFQLFVFCIFQTQILSLIRLVQHLHMLFQPFIHILRNQFDHGVCIPACVISIKRVVVSALVGKLSHQ